MSCVELFLFILKEHFKELNHIRRLDQSSRTGNSHIKYCIARASSTRDLEWFTLTLKTLLYQYKLIYCYWVTHPTDYTFFTCGDMWFVPGGGGGAHGYFLGGYVPPGTPNWHPVLKKIPVKLIPRSRDGPIFYTPILEFALKLIPSSRNGPIFYTPF